MSVPRHLVEWKIVCWTAAAECPVRMVFGAEVDGRVEILEIVDPLGLVMLVIRQKLLFGAGEAFGKTFYLEIFRMGSRCLVAPYL